MCWWRWRWICWRSRVALILLALVVALSMVALAVALLSVALTVASDGARCVALALVS